MEPAKILIFVMLKKSAVFYGPVNYIMAFL